MTASAKRKTGRPKYSVLLPTHNRADVLPFAIKSVFGQTLADFELLIVGDGCTDHTAETVAEFDDSRIRWFDLPKAPNFGYANRNVALREARGEYIAFMAHDDLLLPDHLELLASCLEETEAEIAYSRPVWVIPRGLFAPASFNLNQPETLEKFLARKHNSIPASCFVHRRECLDKYGYWDETLPANGDMDMWARIIEGGGRNNFAYMTQPTCLHFRANWRKETDVQQPWLNAWKALHAVEGLMPAALKLHVAEGVTEQEACWSAMTQNSARWSRDLRSAVACAFDQRVSMSDPLLLELSKTMGTQAPASATLFRYFTQGEALKQIADEADLFQTSLGWRLVRRIREARRAIFPRGTRRGRLWHRLEETLRREI